MPLLTPFPSINFGVLFLGLDVLHGQLLDVCDHHGDRM